jgi:hypothetical protein
MKPNDTVTDVERDFLAKTETLEAWTPIRNCTAETAFEGETRACLRPIAVKY